MSKEASSFLGTPASSRAQVLDSRGYFRFKDTNQLVHRVVFYGANPKAERMWHVHHVNGRKTDNRLHNLMLMQPEKHFKLHDLWPIYDLPNRKQILRWLRTGHLHNKKNKKREHKKRNREQNIAAKLQRRRTFKENRPWKPKGFVPVMIVRKKISPTKTDVIETRKSLNRSPECTPALKK